VRSEPIPIILVAMMRSLVVLLALLSVCWAGVRYPHVKIGAGPLSAEDLKAAKEGTRTRAGSLNYFYPAKKINALYGIDTSDTTRGAGTVIAIVDAYGASTAKTDLAAFASDNGLPAITSANFQKVDQNGGTNYPKDDPDDKSGGGWGVEVALDLQSAHLWAPAAKKILVVTNSANDADLKAGVQWAVNNADYVSLSWGGPEGDSFIDSICATAQANGVSIFASSGDDGFAGGVEYPAASKYIVAVGGTSLYTNSDGTLSSEQAWSGSGGGCSAYTTAIAEQKSASGYSTLGCNGKKAIPDLSSLADPNSGIVINFQGQTFAVGGTSLASPLTAARAAIRGEQVTPAYVYTGGIQYRDITAGNNGGKSAKAGLDLATGIGSWIGSE